MGRGRAPGEAGRLRGLSGGHGGGLAAHPHREGEGRGHSSCWERNYPPRRWVGKGAPPGRIWRLFLHEPPPPNSCGGASPPAGSSPSGRRSPSRPSPTVWQRLGVWGSLFSALGGEFGFREGSEAPPSLPGGLWGECGGCVGLQGRKRPHLQGREWHFERPQSKPGVWREASAGGRPARTPSSSPPTSVGTAGRRFGTAVPRPPDAPGRCPGGASHRWPADHTWRNADGRVFLHTSGWREPGNGRHFARKVPVCALHSVASRCVSAPSVWDKDRESFCWKMLLAGA